jgi:hypothetical protein
MAHQVQVRLKQLNGGGLLLLPVFSFFSLALTVALRFVPVPRLLDIVSRSRRLCFFQGWVDETSLIVAADLAAWISRGSGRCLVRSILLYWALGSRGRPVELFIGVRQENSVLKSHAWIETRGVVLGDRSDVAKDFNPVVRFARS